MLVDKQKIVNYCIGGDRKELQVHLGCSYIKAYWEMEVNILLEI